MWDDDRVKKQRAEFDAVAHLAECYRNLPAVVDDSYPEARHYYEGAVLQALAAFIANGRM